MIIFYANIEHNQTQTTDPPKENKSVYFVSVFRVRMEDQC